MKIWTAVNDIKALLIPYGFSFGVFRQYRATGHTVTCVAAVEQCRRYFTVDAETEAPLLGLYDPSESSKPIEQVVGPVVATIQLNDLVLEGYDDVLRRFGFYPVLIERGSLQLTDFEPVRRSHVMPAGYFGAYRYNRVTLKSLGRLLMGGQYTEKVSYQTARECYGQEFGVVCDHLGCAVAVFYQGVQIL